MEHDQRSRRDPTMSLRLQTRSHLIQQFSVALKQFFSACQPIVSVRWQGSIWKEGLGEESIRLRLIDACQSRSFMT